MEDYLSGKKFGGLDSDSVGPGEKADCFVATRIAGQQDFIYLNQPGVGRPLYASPNPGQEKPQTSAKWASLHMIPLVIPEGAESIEVGLYYRVASSHNNNGTNTEVDLGIRTLQNGLRRVYTLNKSSGTDYVYGTFSVPVTPSYWDDLLTLSIDMRGRDLGIPFSSRESPLVYGSGDQRHIMASVVDGGAGPHEMPWQQSGDPIGQVGALTMEDKGIAGTTHIKALNLNHNKDHEARGMIPEDRGTVGNYDEFYLEPYAVTYWSFIQIRSLYITFKFEL